MEPHRPPPSKREPSTKPRRKARRDALPLGREWLEREAIRYVAKWESTRHGVTELLERKLEQRCDRTGEDAAPVRDAIPGVVESLVERNYLNDRRFAENQFERLRRQGRSRAQIRARLEAKGIDRETLEEVEEARSSSLAQERAEARDGVEGDTDTVDEELEAAWRTARKRRIGPYCADADRRTELRDRHLAVLARQGFSSETAYAVIDAAEPREQSGTRHELQSSSHDSADTIRRTSSDSDGVRG